MPRHVSPVTTRGAVQATPSGRASNSLMNCQCTHAHMYFKIPEGTPLGVMTGGVAIHKQYTSCILITSIFLHLTSEDIITLLKKFTHKNFCRLPSKTKIF